MPATPNERESTLDLGVSALGVAHHWYTQRSNNQRGWKDRVLGVLPFTDNLITADVRTRLTLTPTNDPDVFLVSGAAELVDKNGNTAPHKPGWSVKVLGVGEEWDKLAYQSRMVKQIKVGPAGAPYGRLSVYYTVDGGDGPIFGAGTLKVSLTKNRDTGDVEAIVNRVGGGREREKVVNVVPVFARERERTSIPPRPEAAATIGVGRDRVVESRDTSTMDR